MIFQPEAFAQLVRNPFPALESLKLNNVRLRAREATQLAGAAFTTTLKELLLDNCELGVAGVEALVATRFPVLTTLDLSRNRLGSRGGIALANAAPSFLVLTTLKLWDNKLNSDAVTALADNPLLANLTELDLNSNKIGPAGAIALANSKYLKHLKTFTVDEKTVGKKGKQALLDRFGEDVISWR
ncbi:Leucine-rich repeat-containing protein typical subtype OS=Herpetosiphon aurantiacus (strain ATCC 23779 / DSM 785) GN=Haur_4051 PE=4 SV=1: LRR_6: LRR_6: LRR_6 [Gemmata massiliana]|uniref:Uncharacterized protein n=1 Tax=Gemmata massiliana TaxID=1210884 RepID=A0A6P2D935_9BACT|nr:hypothetical protein [Gemmata massiliana]VTR96000.1 Leucine-rich repeat-containing protein typical subtype OS=Herpetosiphon aurantiacus (strain ATCC 23779 / DSM 785) GN=Haur_4051 PE=4 SV=1: LRR_6: LRR_6: LRR_6 [Gemmata massiliana]